MSQVLALVLDAGEKRQFNVSTDTLKIANAVNPTDAVAYGQLIDTASGSSLFVPVTKNDYLNSFVIPDSGALVQPTRSTLTTTERITLAATGRETLYDPLNNPYFKGAYNQPPMVIRSGEFVQQNLRLITVGNERATFTEDARLFLRNEPFNAINVTSPITFSTAGSVGLDVFVDHAFTAAQTITVTDTATTTITDVAILSHNSSAGTSASFGPGLVLKGKSSTTNDRLMGRIEAGWSVSTDASRTSWVGIECGTNQTAFQGTAFRVYYSGFLTNDTASDAGSAYINSNAGYLVASATPANGKLLQSDGSSYKTSGMTWPTAAVTARKIVVSTGSNMTASTETWAVPGTALNILQSDGTNWASVAPPPPITLTAYGTSFTIADTGLEIQPTRITFASTERETIAGTGRNTLYDPSNTPLTICGKGSLSPGSFILRDQEFMLQYKRIAVVGNQRATMTDTARYVSFDDTSSVSRLVLAGSSQNNN